MRFDDWRLAVQVVGVVMRKKPQNKAVRQADSEDIANTAVGAVVGGMVAGSLGLVIGAAAGSLIGDDASDAEGKTRNPGAKRPVRKRAKRRNLKQSSGPAQ